jgi:hypothetical protein
MPPPIKATKVKSINSPSSGDSLVIPGPTEFNEPPTQFNKFLKCYFGKKGVGKSTLASEEPNNLTFMLEPMRKNLRIRAIPIRKYTPEEIINGAPDAWGMIMKSVDQIIDDETIQNVTFDSIDIAYECKYASICASNNVASPNDAGKGSADVWIEIRDTWASDMYKFLDSRLSLTLLSHLAVREDEQLDMAKVKVKQPSCSPACLKWIKQACEFVFYYGEINKEKILQVRDDTGMSEIASGVEGRFLQPNGQPIIFLPMPALNGPVNGYQTLVKAFNNECWDYYTPEDEKTPKPPTTGTTTSRPKLPPKR